MRVRQRGQRDQQIGRASTGPGFAAGAAQGGDTDRSDREYRRTESDRRKNAREIRTITSQLNDENFVRGFGSMGGEEFFSYLNVSDGLKRAGGDEWKRWHSQTVAKIVALQNNDGTWTGHHCITGRVAVTSAAILNLTVDRL